VLADLAQDGSGVTATLDDGTTLRARYVVGADGMHSTVRERAGIGFSGDSYGESFVLADVRMHGGVPEAEVILYFSPAGGPERERAVVQEVLWGSRFRVHHRVADTYRAGRVLLAGDAAHVHSPAGGQGMNAGILDAMQLANALCNALLAGDPELLDAYGRERRPIAEQVVAFADRLTKLATVRPALRVVRNLMLRALSCLPAFRHNLALRLSGLVYRPALPAPSTYEVAPPAARIPSK
jgi:2-polyprenyl-6-methoxyphenol hydroxylase-like FAD-dependent oxidoreductase